MVGVGIAWASTLSMPYSVLAGSLPKEKTGVYMGIFNFFIVTPEIIASLFFGWVMNHMLRNNRLTAVVAGGCFMLIAALLMQRVVDPAEEKIKVHETQNHKQPARNILPSLAADEVNWKNSAWAHADQLAATGTPRAILTRTSASKSLIGSVPEPGISCSSFSTVSGRQANSTAPCVPKVVVPARIITYRPDPIPGTSPMTE